MTRKSHTTFAKLILLGTLYFSQGVPYGFFTQTLPTVMRQQGYSLGVIGLSSLLAIPWAFKFLWAPLVDRFGSKTFGRRRSWLIPLQLATMGALLVLAALGTSPTISFLLLGMFVTNIFSATQDIATDGLAVDLLTPSERGVANGLQVAGYRVGMMVGGGALLIVLERIGWSSAFVAMSIVTLLATLPLVRLREDTLIVSRSDDTISKIKSTPHFFRRKNALYGLAIIFVYKLGDYLASTMVRPLLVDRGLTLEDIGWLLGTIGFFSGLVGAMIGGVLTRRLGRKRSLMVFGLVEAVTLLGFVVAATYRDRFWLYLVSTLEYFTGGMATVALFTCMMDWSRISSGATDYTVQASTVVIATGIASGVAGFLAQQLGYPVHFFLSSIVTFAAVILVQRWFTKANTLSDTLSENDDKNLANCADLR